jgi:AcrR family transcriptional regulator
MQANHIRRRAQSDGQTDARVRRGARAKLLAAFGEMVVHEPYDRLAVNAIARRSSVARSSFYEHFQSKDELLVESLRPLFTALASSVRPEPDLALVEAVLTHLHAARERALAVLTGRTRTVLADLLTEIVQDALADGPPRRGGLPRCIEARRLAEGHVGAIVAWLDDGAGISAHELARGLSI